MSYQLPSSVGTSQNYIPVVPPAERFKYPGLGVMIADTMTMLNSWIAAETANIAASAAMWPNGQGLQVAGEPKQAVRVWNGTDAKTVVIAGGKEFQLTVNSNTIGTTSGAPTGNQNQGDLKIDKATGLVYQQGASAWGAGAFGFAVSASAPTGPTAYRYLQFRVDSANGGGNEADIFALMGYTADGTDRLAGLTYVNANANDYPSGNVLTNGHTNASNWYTTAMPASATFDLTTARAIDHIAINPGNTPVTNAAKLPTSVSLLGSNDNTTFALIKTWAGIDPSQWGTNNNGITRTFNVN